MYIHDAVETAYKNGFEAGMRVGYEKVIARLQEIPGVTIYVESDRIRITLPGVRNYDDDENAMLRCRTI